MTEGSDDKLTAAKHLAAILSIDLRPSGKLEGTIRDAAHHYRFSGLTGLPAAVLRWLTEEIGRPIESDVDGVRTEDTGPTPSRPDDDQPCL
ncbi:hypothetical protein ASE38_17235 [Cellulomonas sp. Root930]|nr:hypothetical protein ASE38_17235 [Cellulomonas sp. Root930]